MRVNSSVGPSLQLLSVLRASSPHLYAFRWKCYTRICGAIRSTSSAGSSIFLSGFSRYILFFLNSPVQPGSSLPRNSKFKLPRLRSETQAAPDPSYTALLYATRHETARRPRVTSWLPTSTVRFFVTEKRGDDVNACGIQKPVCSSRPSVHEQKLTVPGQFLPVIRCW